MEMPDPWEAFFYDEDSARQYLENVRWPDGPACIRCQSKNVIRMGGRTQAGMFLCRECRNKFSCRMGTAMEHSHVPLHKWLLALLLVTPSRGYLSPQKLKLQLGLGSYRTAWLMTQRIRDALWRHRRELERQGSRRGLISSLPHTPPLSPGGLASPSSACFDDALNALITCPPKRPERARIEQKRPFQPRAITALAVAEAQAIAVSSAAPARKPQGAGVAWESATSPSDVAEAMTLIAR
jgi:Transposase zinc-ribbon domain